MKNTQSGGSGARNASVQDGTGAFHQKHDNISMPAGRLVDHQHFAVMSFSVWQRQLFVKNVLVLMAFLGPGPALRRKDLPFVPVRLPSPLWFRAGLGVGPVVRDGKLG